MLEKISLILSAEKENLKKQINDSDTLNLENLQKKLNDILNNIQLFQDFKLEEVSKYLNPQDLRELEYFQKALGFKVFLIKENEINNAIKLIKLLEEKITNELNEIKNRTNQFKSINDLILELELKIDGLSNGGYLNSDDIRNILNILKKHISDETELNDIVSNLCLLSISNVVDHNRQIEEEKVEEPIETNLSRDLVGELLRKYGYDINEILDYNLNNLLLKYGNLDNIEGILKVLSEYGIKINLVFYQDQFCTILTHSKKENVAIILNNLKDDILGKDDITLEDMFIKILKHQECFINRKRIYKKSDASVPSISNQDDIVGHFEDYRQNRDYFKSLGLNIFNIMIKTDTALYIPHEKVKKNIENFKYYEIPRESYENALTCLLANNPFEAFDQFIELDCYDYLLSNFSRTRLPYNSYIFYRIVKVKNAIIDLANKRNLSPNAREEFIKTETRKALFRKFRDKEVFRGIISDKKNEELGINATNGSKVVGQIFPDFIREIDETINIDVSEFDGELDLAMADDMIKALESEETGIKKSNLLYEFDGIRISRNKVLRYYELLIRLGQGQTFNALMYAICKYSILNEEQFNKIKKCVEEKIINRGVNR